MEDPEFMTVDEIAKLLRQSPRWVRREAPSYGLPLYGAGHMAVGIKKEILAWVKQNRIAA